MYDPNSALVASGGRMGGGSISLQSSSSSSSRSCSVPRMSSPGFSYSVPYYVPSPFGFSGGVFYVGPAVGFGMGAGSSFFLILMGFAAFVLVSGFLSDRSEGGVLTATEKWTKKETSLVALIPVKSICRRFLRISYFIPCSLHGDSHKSECNVALFGLHGKCSMFYYKLNLDSLYLRE